MILSLTLDIQKVDADTDTDTFSSEISILIRYRYDTFRQKYRHFDTDTIVSKVSDLLVFLELGVVGVRAPDLKGLGLGGVALYFVRLGVNIPWALVLWFPAGLSQPLMLQLRLERSHSELRCSRQYPNGFAWILLHGVSFAHALQLPVFSELEARAETVTS